MQKGINLDNDVYVSLLETIALNPKKKHFKKLIQHLLMYKDVASVDSKLIDLMTSVD